MGCDKGHSRTALHSPFYVGEKVEVSYKRRWYPAHVLDIRGGSHYVSYDDYDTDENEWVPTTRIRKLEKKPTESLSH
ncbi:MAG: agenet domain-containing protein [Pyrinomonadaceae bacterium]